MATLSNKSLAGRPPIMRFLIAFVLGAVCLGVMVAVVVYTDTHSTTTAEGQVSHAQEVLLDLANSSEELQRIDLRAMLYRQTHDENHLREAQGATVALNTLVLRLQRLVDDDAAEAKRARTLAEDAASLSLAVQRLTPVGPTVGTPVRDQVLQCRRTLTAIQDEERALLDTRLSAARRMMFYGLVRRMATVLIGTVLVLVLFGFLVRDAIRRTRFEAQLSETNARLRTTVQRLEEQAWASHLLIAARDEVALCLEVDEAEACTIRYFEQLLPGTVGTLSLLSNSRHLLETVGTWGGQPSIVSDSFAPEECCALRSGRSRWRRPEISEVHCSHFVGTAPQSYLCIPLVAHGETLGTVTIECSTAEICATTRDRETTIASLAEMAAMAIAGLNLRHKLEIQSIRDGMTGLFNRSFMEIALERELSRAARQGKQIAVMMLDIDHFKQFNDAFGHEAGDVVLREVAECLRVQVRAEDVVCRYGGEEFVIILPEISTASAMERAEILRRMVGELALRYHGQPLRQVTVSIGVALYPGTAENPETLLRAADVALYAAKHRGRNRVVQAENSAGL